MAFTPPGAYSSSYQSASYVQPPPVPVTGPTHPYHTIPTFTSSHVGAAPPNSSYVAPSGSYVAPSGSYGPTPTYSQPNTSFYQPGAYRPSSTVTANYPGAHSITPQQPATFITSGSVGRIIPTEQPYAFTTVTYAKQPVKPNHEEFKKAYARQTMQNLDDDRAPRIVKKQKGACGGLNECMCGCCDKNGGCCGCLNCGGCCDREQHVPVSIATPPRTSKGCC